MNFRNENASMVASTCLGIFGIVGTDVGMLERFAFGIFSISYHVYLKSNRLYALVRDYREFIQDINFLNKQSRRSEDML